MRKLAAALLLAVALILVLAPPSLAGGRRHHHGHHHGGTRVFVGVGPRFWWGPWGPYGYPYYYPYPYYAPPVVVREPPVYVQQQVTPAPAEPSAPEAGYWYYCESAREYYPTTPTCSEAWIKVPPRQE